MFTNSGHVFDDIRISFGQMIAGIESRALKTGWFGIQEMTDSEVRKAILDDLVSPTLWEVERGQSVKFDIETLLEFVTDPVQRQRVLAQLSSELISSLITIEDGSPIPGKQIRVKKDKGTIQAVLTYMDSIFADFYSFPDDFPAGPTGIRITNAD